MINSDFNPQATNEILSAYNIGPLLDPRGMHENPFFGLMEYDGVMICKEVSNGIVRFCFADDSRQQAVAIYAENLVVVFRGMFEVLCKVAAKIVAKGLYPNLGEATSCNWSINSAREKFSAREIINGELNFNWDDESCPWRMDEERKALFVFCLTTLFRFVISHELGHLYYKHGDKEKRLKYSGIEIDAIDSVSRERGFNPQARELVADKYGFDLVIDYQKRHLASQKHEGIGRILYEKLAKSDYDLAVFVMQMVYVYFYISERDVWKREDPETWSHPPAPFRLRTICASVIQDGVLEIKDEQALGVLNHVLLSSAPIIAVLFERKPEPTWLVSSREKILSEHYAKIFPLLFVWSSCREVKWHRKKPLQTRLLLPTDEHR